jgi:hypothetical protein
MRLIVLPALRRAHRLSATGKERKALWFWEVGKMNNLSRALI